MRERLVIDGRMELDLGVTTSPSFVIKMKLAPPVSSTYVLGGRIQEHIFIKSIGHEPFHGHEGSWRNLIQPLHDPFHEEPHGQNH